MRHRAIVSLAILVLLAGACTPAQDQRQAPGASNDRPAQGRTLVVAHRYEPGNLAVKVLQSNGTLNTARLFNAALTYVDDQGIPRPYLAEGLPQLNTDSWRVFPDGRMETTYTLKENLTWQDGTPLTADDFAFAFRVYTDPGLGVFISSPQDTMETVTATDPRTLVIQWRTSNPVAGSLGFEELDPLPRHLQESAFADYRDGRSTGEAFMADPTWTTGYVGAGPFRLERWDQGVQLEGSAFPGHILGKPKIDRIVVRIYLDENQTMATVLAGGQVDYACCNTLRFNQYVTLKREWEPTGKGQAAAIPGVAVFLYLQQRPEYVSHEALLDVRVKRALAHAIDRDAINEGLFDGLGAPTDSPIPPNLPYFAEADRMATKYPLDVNRASQLMSDAGFTKDSGGFFADRSGRRFHLNFSVQAASEIERMQQILADSWRRAGFEVQTDVIAPQVYTQLDTRHTLPGVSYAFFQGESGFLSSEIGTAANRWRGRNRTGWSNPEYDRLFDAWSAALDRTERERTVGQMMGLVSDSIAGYPLYFSQLIVTWSSALKGPTGKEASQFGSTSRPTTNYWNVHEWSY
jgi:peptide/nickel transport system substrate-binding protein